MFFNVNTPDATKFASGVLYYYSVKLTKGREKMPVVIKRKNQFLYAFLKGEIDHHTAPDIREAIDDALSSSESCETLVLDFNEVSFMDSSGVGLVMGRYRYATTLNKKVRVDNLDNRNYKIMQMSGIEKIAEINRRDV